MEIIKGLNLHNTAKGHKKRRNRVLLIGINTYLHWDNLEYPVSDCQQLFKLLKDHYGFQDNDLIQFLENEQATADVIYDELYRLQEVDDESGKPHLTVDDNLIIVYSGHGHFNEKLRQGYWAPWNAPIPDPKRPSDLRNLVSVDEVARLLSQLKAQHILLIVDACFPQAFTYENVDVPHEIRAADRNNPEEIPSRWIMTAGRLEPVPDHSFFARALREELHTNQEPQLSIKVLDSRVRTRMAQETNGRWKPDCQLVVDGELRGGEFYFHRHTEARRTDQAPHPAASIVNLADRLRQGSTVHLDRLKKGRFKLLRIEKLLLTSANLPDFIDTKVKSGAEETPLQQAVNSLWGKGKPHAVVLGEGGMGKTVSLVRLWEDLLNGQPSSIPIFVALNEYNAVPESEKYDFVLRSIARNCGLAEALTDDWKNALWDFLKAPLPDGFPAVLLLLDGFNEVTIQKDQLLIDLNRLAEQTKGMQMVITSRYVEIQNFTWAQHSKVVELLPLPLDKIEVYLGDPKVNVPMPADEGLRKLFTNPMMLTLYAGSSSIARKYEGDKRFRFLPTSSYGELLWNFNEAQLAKHLEDCEHDLDEQTWHIFLLRCLVPALAYRMEEEGQFFIPTRKALNPAFNFKSLLDEAFVALNREELSEIFPEFEGKRSLLGLSEIADMDAREQRSLKVRQYLVEKMHLLVAEDEALRFVHQNFRDFFAACHLRNVAKMAILKKNLPSEWQFKTFSFSLRQILGNIEGEHYFSTIEAIQNKSNYNLIEKSVLIELLDCCRGIYENEGIQYLNWNILQTISDSRSTFAGMNMEYLDLSKLYLKGTPLSRYIGNCRYFPAQLKGSLMQGKLLFVQGHSYWVTKVCYSPDSKKILCSSDDYTIKEWSVETGACLQTFTGHSSFVNSACYSPDGKNILSASEDGTLKMWSVEKGMFICSIGMHSDSFSDCCFSPDGKKILSASHQGVIEEWSLETGILLQKFKGHTSCVSCICYNQSGDKVLSGSQDGTIKEWSVKTSLCLKTFIGHSHFVNSVQYNPDEKKILSASHDKTMKEWLIDTGECCQTIKGHTDRVSCASYSPDGKRIISASYDKTIREWSAETGSCLRTFKGHLEYVTSICFSHNGKKIISASHDRSLKEWLIETGDCIQTFEGYFDEISKSIYSNSYKKILTISADNTIKEWEIKTGFCLQILLADRKVEKICSSPDGKNILAVFEDLISLIEWSVETGECLQSFFVENKINQIAYSPCGKKALLYYKKESIYDDMVASDSYVQEWALENGVCLHTYSEKSIVRNAYYSFDGEKILIVKDQVIEEWSVNTKKCINIIKVNFEIENACYGLDNKIIFSYSFIKPIKSTEDQLSSAKEPVVDLKEPNVRFNIWSIETGKCITEYIVRDDFYHYRFTPCCLSLDGHEIQMLSKDGYGVVLRRWAVNDGQELQKLVGDQGRAIFAVTSGEGRELNGTNYFLTKDKNKIEERNSNSEIVCRFINEVGLYIQSCDFRHLHPSSHFTEEEKERLRRYGAIFNDEDERRWKATVEDAYGEL